MPPRTDRSAKTPRSEGRARHGGAGLTLLTSLLTLAAAPNLAQAQSATYFSRNYNVGVLDRPRPDYQPLGIDVGPFTLSPSLNISPQYDSNIFASSNDVASDVITTLQPSLSLNSTWPRDAFNLNLAAASNFYVRHSDQNTTNYSANASGRLDLFSDTHLTGGLSFNHTTEPRTDEGSIETSTNSAPVQYDTTSANLGAVETLNRIQLTQQALFQHYDYSDSADAQGQGLGLGYLNGDFSQFTVRGDYALTPELSAYLSGQYNRREYPSAIGVTDRNSSGYDISAGSSFDITRLIRGQIGFGYLSQTYVSPLYKPVNGPSVHVNVDYFISDLTTLGLDVNRTVIDAEDPTAVSYVQTHGDLRADHELLRNLILSASLAYESDAFTGYDRTDRRLNASLSGSYLINRDLSLSAAYSYLSETSTGLNRIPGYDVSIVSLGLNLHL